MSPAVRIGLLGGTLDPIHLGHIETAAAARRALDLDRVYVLPSHMPPHRSQQPVASGYHRFAMTALAVNGLDGLAASDVELRTPGPSYTADTLSRFRERSGLSPLQIFFITGADAFAEIETWYRYPDVLGLAQFVVVSRPGFPVEPLRDRLPGLMARMTSVRMEASKQPPAASRQPPAASRDSTEEHAAFSSIFLVDAPTPDVSSTGIRRRLAAGEPITGLVPAAVERHIVQHGLYTEGAGPLAADHLHGEN
jgi:nicotinate-nucleotide adenylyltransferase